MRELPLKYRPKTLDEIVGQDKIVQSLEEKLSKGKLPHSLMFTGPPGTGKTSAARIVAFRLGCNAKAKTEGNGFDLREINAAENRGIDNIREIIDRLPQRPMYGDVRVFIFDECHQLSRRKDGDAQTALLKPLEEPREFNYFILCTTDPQDLLPAIKSRCTTFRFDKVKPEDMNALITSVAKKEKIKLEDRVLHKIVDLADGSCRDALKLLDLVSDYKTEEERCGALERADAEKASIDLCRVLCNPRSKWSDVAPVVKAVDEDPERIRRAVLGYFASVALGAKGPVLERAMNVIYHFRDNFFDSGRAGLVLACHDSVSPKK